MEVEIGYVVSDIILTGPERGTYKVWVPKKHGDPTSSASYSGFGANLGNLGSAEFYQIQQVAESYYPMMPLSSGGHMPFDPQSGLVSTTEVVDEINLDNVTTLSNGEFSAVKNKRNPQGDDQTFFFPQTYPENGMFQVYAVGQSGGETINTRSDTPTGSFCNLSLGTKVVVAGNIILGQLPQTQNDLINQLRPANKA